MGKTISIITLFVAEFAFYASGYVVHMIAGRTLGPEDYGRYGLVITATLLIANLVGSGVPVAMSRFLSGTDDDGTLREIRKKSALAQILVMSATTIAFFLLAPSFSVWLGDPGLAPLFRLATLIIPCYAADSFYFYLFSGMRRVGAQSALKFTRAIVRVGAVAILASIFRLEGILTAYVLVPLGVLAIAVAIDAFRPAIPRAKPSDKNGSGFPLRKILSLSVPITIFFILFETLLSFDIYVLKSLSGNDTLTGEYNAALTVARIPSFLFYALTLLILPSISESHAKADFGRMKETVGNAIRFMLVLALPFIAVVSAYPETILSIFFGDGFDGAAIFLPTLTAASSILAMAYVISFAYKGAGKISVPIAFVGAGIVMNLGLDLTLLPVIGNGAIAALKLATVTAISPFFLRSVRKTFDAGLPVPDILKITAASGIVFALARWGGDSLKSLLLATVPLGTLYILLIILFRVVTKKDFALLRGEKTAGTES